jgi:hypothetical protein
MRFFDSQFRNEVGQGAAALCIAGRGAIPAGSQVRDFATLPGRTARFTHKQMFIRILALKWERSRMHRRFCARASPRGRLAGMASNATLRSTN